jgi:hypothetical protein
VFLGYLAVDHSRAGTRTPTTTATDNPPGRVPTRHDPEEPYDDTQPPTRPCGNESKHASRAFGY